MALSKGINPVRAKLSHLRDGLGEEMQQILDADPTVVIERQYDGAVAVLKHFGLVDDAGEPVRGGVKLPDKQAIIDSFDPEQLRLAVSMHFHCPILILVPETNFGTLVDAIDSHPLTEQNPGEQRTLLPDNNQKLRGMMATVPTFREDQRGMQITGWRAMIVEGARGPQTENVKCAPQENLYEFIKRVKGQRGNENIYLRGIDRYAYAMLIMTSMMNAGDDVENLMDRYNSTLLDEDEAMNWPDKNGRDIPVAKYRRRDPDDEPGGRKHENAWSFYMSVGRLSGYGGHHMRHAVVGNRIPA